MSTWPLLSSSSSATWVTSWLCLSLLLVNKVVCTALHTRSPGSRSNKRRRKKKSWLFSVGSTDCRHCRPRNNNAPLLRFRLRIGVHIFHAAKGDFAYWIFGSTYSYWATALLRRFFPSDFIKSPLPPPVAAREKGSCRFRSFIYPVTILGSVRSESLLLLPLFFSS